MKQIRFRNSEGLYEFPTVKDVGDIDKLLTKAKTDLVSSINEIFNKIGASDTTVSLSEIIAEVQAKILEQQKALQDKIDSVTYNAYVKDVNAKMTELLNKTLTFEENFTTIDNKFIQTDKELSNKITSESFNNAVGVGKWKVTEYGLKTISEPIVAQTLLKVPSMAVYEIDDSLVINTSTGVTSLYTNVYNDSEKTIILDFKQEKNVAVYLNGALLSSDNTVLESRAVSVFLNRGWNTIEIFYDSALGNFTFNGLETLNSRVQKMSTVIGANGKNETMYSNVSTEMKQLSDLILLSATKEEVKLLSGDVTNQKAEIKVLSDKILNTVTSEIFNIYTKKLELAETQIKQNTDSIALKVDTSTHDTLNSKVTTQETELNLLKEQIKLTVSQTVFDGLKDIVTSHNASIDVLKNSITNTVTKTEFDEKFKTYDVTFSEIKQTADTISTTIANYDKAISNITQTYDKIVAEIYNADGSSKIEQKFDEINLIVREFGKKYSEIGGKNLLTYTKDFGNVVVSNGWTINPSETDREGLSILTNVF